MLLRTLILAGVGIAMTLGASRAAAQNNPVVVMETNLGNITIELLKDKAPISVENFIKYVNDGYYTGTIFHRVIQQFMIQGGGMTAELTRKRARDPIKNEAANGVSNERGTVAMARLNAVNSATSQFFINTANNAGSLDHRDADYYGYAVFGHVIDGMDVVDKIAAVATQTQGSQQNIPIEPVVIGEVSVK